jgi:hypothetical protein
MTSAYYFSVTVARLQPTRVCKVSASVWVFNVLQYKGRHLRFYRCGNSSLSSRVMPPIMRVEEITGCDECHAGGCVGHVSFCPLSIRYSSGGKRSYTSSAED